MVDQRILPDNCYNNGSDRIIVTITVVMQNIGTSNAFRMPRYNNQYINYDYADIGTRVLMEDNKFSSNLDEMQILDSRWVLSQCV